MIIPQNNIATTNYQPIYIHSDDRSAAEKCLDTTELQDIMNKRLKNEQLDDSDVERINACIAESREFGNKVLAIFVILLIVIILACMFLA